MKPRAEVDTIEAPTPTIGGAEPLPEEEHGAHVFLYIPDLTERSGFSTHRVLERVPERTANRGMGFRR